MTSRTSRGNGSGLSLTGPPAGDLLPMAQAAGALAAFQAAAASLVVVLVPVVATWVVTGGGSASWLEVVKVAAALWLLAQHTGLEIEGGRLALLPLGLTLVPLLACGYAGTRLARSLDPRAARIAAGATRAAPSPAPRAALLTMASSRLVDCRITLLSSSARIWKRPFPAYASISFSRLRRAL